MSLTSWEWQLIWHVSHHGHFKVTVRPSAKELCENFVLEV